MIPSFIVGSDRSGTTLLRLIVNEHSQLAVPAETWFLVDLIAEFGVEGALDGPAVERAIAIITATSRWKNFGLSVDELRSALAERREVTLAHLFGDLMRLEIAPTGKPRWVDKTPEYVLHLSDLAKVFPSAKFVHISRDGRDVFRSLKKQRWRGRTALRIGTYWAACIDSARSASEELPADRWLWVRYEDLVLNMETTVRRVCEFLDVPFEPAMLDFHTTAADHVPAQSIERGFHRKLLRPPAPTDVYRWKAEPRDWHTWMFESVTAEQLVAAGYELRIARWQVAFMRPVTVVQHVVASAWVKLTKNLRAAPKSPVGA